jgi:hypothetical protein
MSTTHFSHNLIKGRVAETIIQELFQANDYNVFSYGMERTVPAIIHGIRGMNTEVAKAIRSMPDFVMQNTRNGELFYVEVKYRAWGHFALKDLIEDYPYTNAHFIIVTNRNILHISYNELKEGKRPVALKNDNLFGLSAKSLKVYREYVGEFLGGDVEK